MKLVLPASLFALLALCVCSAVHGQENSTIFPPDTTGADSVHISLPRSKGGLTAQVQYRARDSVRFSLRESKVYLYGDAQVIYTDMQLNAAFIEVDFKTNDIHAKGTPDSMGNITGKPGFKSQGKEYSADEMWYNFKSRKGISSGVITTESDGFVRGEKFLKDSADNIYVRGATFTTCTAPDPHFWIEAGKFKIVPKKQVVSGPANLVVEGVHTPLLVPFAFFPISQNRSKGIVFGTYGETQDRGFFLANWGYYLPVNSYFDLKLTADYYFRGSYGFNLVSRYRKRYRYDGQFGFRFNKNYFGEKESPDYRVSNDIAVNWNFQRDAKAKPGSGFSANVNFVTRNQLRNNSNEVNDILATNANSSINYSKSFLDRKINLSASGRLDQNLSSGDMAIRLPDINLNLVRVQPFKDLKGSKNKKVFLRNLGFSYQALVQNSLQINQDSIFDVRRNTVRFKPDVQENLRFGLKHAIPLSTSFKAFKYFNVSPNASFTDYWYFSTLEKRWEGDSLISDKVKGFERASSFQTGVSMNTTIFGYKQFRKGKVYAIRHVMRPTLSANWSPSYDRRPEAGYREVQVDTAGNTAWYSIFEQGLLGRPGGGASGSLNLGIGNNLEMKIRSAKDTASGGLKKIKLIESFNVSSGYNFLADSLKLSNIGLSGNTTLFEKLSFTFGAGMDPYTFVYDSFLRRNVRIDRFQWEQNRRPARLTNARISMSTNLNPQALKRKSGPGLNEAELEVINAYSRYFVDFNIPWSLNLSYSFNYFKSFNEEAAKEQTVTFNGDVKLTENWKIGFSSGYNFKRRESTLTRLDLFRDLHCWEFSFGWIPTGTFRRFDFVIRVKSATLQDLKLSRRGFWYDN